MSTYVGGVSPQSNVCSRDNERAPKQRANAAPGRLATSDTTGGPMPIMLSPALSVQIEARDSDNYPAGSIPPAEAVPLLQAMLANAIETRGQAVAEIERLRSLEADKHWFVPGLDGYCAACSLPAINGRHVARPAA